MEIILLAVVFYLIFKFHAWSDENPFRLFPKKCRHGTTLHHLWTQNSCSFCLKEHADELRHQANDQAEADRLRREREASLKKAEEQKTLDEAIARQYNIEQYQRLEYLKTLDPYEFERVVMQMFSELGYSDVSVTPKSSDGGIDGIMHKDGNKFVVQCKRLTNGNVGVQVLTAIVGSMIKEKAQFAVVVTTGGFTPQAWDWARGQPVKLMAGKLLAKNMTTAFKGKEFLAEIPVTDNHESAFRCPECDSIARKRKSRHGWFWGCSSYPECRWTQNIPSYEQPKKGARKR